MKRWPEPNHWPLLVVTHWRPAVAGLEQLGYVQEGATLIEVAGR